MNHPDISERLTRAIEGGCGEMSGIGIQALAREVQLGISPWFVDEFADAIRRDVFTPENFGKLVGFDWDDEDTDQLDLSLHRIWEAVAPGQPYPGDETA